MPTYFVAKSAMSIFTGQIAGTAQRIATLTGSPSMLKIPSSISESLSEAEEAEPAEDADVDVADVADWHPSDSF